MLQNGISIFATGLLAGFISITLTPLVIRLAKRHAWYDDPSDPRKIHDGEVPRLGGAAMFWAFILSVSLASILGARMPSDAPWGPVYLPVTLALVLVHVTGLVDDFHSLRARYKLSIQLLAAIVAVFMDFRFRFLPLPGIMLNLGWASYPITVLWIVGIMNAINMIDGMDGLAGGVCLIASFAFGVTYTRLGLIYPATEAFALVGAIVGFLFYNFPKASIFMGDSGSLFLGFSLALLPLLHKSSYPIEAGILPGITVLLVPIFDVFAAILRRSRRGQSIMMPDREHIHHKLMDFGFEPRQILAMVYGVCLFLAGVVLGGLFFPFAIQFWLIIAVWVGCLALFLIIHYTWHRRRAMPASSSPSSA
jgi:UDP-GlcNAc:undecaprenyl-phosphate GlcNAc-1-phosphate transferase